MLQEQMVRRGLSNREVEVAKVVVQGKTNKETANLLFVTEKTVKFHLTNIYKKLAVKSRTQMIVWAASYMGASDWVEKEPIDRKFGTPNPDLKPGNA